MVRPAVDDFIIYFAAKQDKLDREVAMRLQPFRHMVRQLPANWPGTFTAQYIAHRIFKQDGLINRYLNHAALKALGQKEREFLQQQMKNPWRYSFSIIVANPAEHVYKMLDVFREQEFYLYSPGMTDILKEHAVLLWFNLVGFNGECWETYGPISGYRSFEEDDIFFFATEWNPQIQSVEDLVKDVERNPVPYALLISGSNLPTIFKKQDELIHLAAWLELETFNSSQLSDRFSIAYNQGVYKMALKRWSNFPHFAIAYYDEGQKELMLSALTDRGYEALATQLRLCGFNTAEADVRVRQNMLSVASEILKKEIDLNPYEDLFKVDPDPQHEAQLDSINRVLQLALPYVNSDKQPDINALAAKAGVDPEEVREAVEKSIAHIQKMRDKLR